MFRKWHIYRQVVLSVGMILGQFAAPKVDIVVVRMLWISLFFVSLSNATKVK